MKRERRCECVSFLLARVMLLILTQQFGRTSASENDLESFATKLDTLEKVFAKDAVEGLRCYCNMASCASASHMCRTSNGKCFFELHAGHVTLHGCTDLDSALASDCHTMRKDASDLPVPLRICCGHHLCNHPAYVRKWEKRLEDPQRNGSLGAGEHNSKGFIPETSIPLSPQEIWFRAAVIVVPIIGGCILMMLVVLAIRLLQPDSWRRQHKPATICAPGSYSQSTAQSQLLCPLVGGTTVWTTRPSQDYAKLTSMNV